MNQKQDSGPQKGPNNKPEQPRHNRGPGGRGGQGRNNQNRGPKQGQKGGQRGGQNQNKGGGSPMGGSRSSRSQAIRASRRNSDDAQQAAALYSDASQVKSTMRANTIDDSSRLRIIGLGGMDGGGSKNMMLIEYQDEAIVIDAGNDLE